MSDRIDLNWRALATIYHSFLISVAFAAGHHAFYQHLAGTPVPTTNNLTVGTWAGVSSQKYNTAIGNTLASLFRTFLSITVTTAYVQIIWKSLKSESTKLKVVDAITGPSNGVPLTLFVATFPKFTEPYHSGGLDPSWDYQANATVVQCSLINATYSASYKWTNGIWDLNITVTPSGPSLGYPEPVLCKNFQGSVSINDDFFRSFAYASVMEAFMDPLQGSLYYTQGTVGLVTSTRVMSTIIGATKELTALQNEIASNIETGPAWAFGPIGTPVEIQANSQGNSTLDLRATLEVAFQNATMSLMSSPVLQPDPRSSSYPPPVNVTTITYHSHYAYSAAMLWCAYGTALLIAAITGFLGAFAVCSTGLSYSPSFSTVLRTTSRASVSTKILREDAVGRDPLPKHLAEATITFHHAHVNEEEAVRKRLVAK